MRINHMATWLRDLPDDEFIRWVEAEARYLDRRDMTLNQFNYGEHCVDLWEHPKLCKLVEQVKANLAAAADPKEEEEVQEDA